MFISSHCFLVCFIDVGRCHRANVRGDEAYATKSFDESGESSSKDIFGSYFRLERELLTKSFYESFLGQKDLFRKELCYHRGAFPTIFNSFLLLYDVINIILLCYCCYCS